MHPQRLEAIGHVFLQTPDLTDHDTEQLVLIFKDAPQVMGPPAPGAAGSAWTTPLAPAVPPAPKSGPATATASTAQAAPQPAPKKPIDLSARTVQAFVIRRGEVNDLDTLLCEDDVRVHQDPVPPQVRPVNMRGQKLILKHTTDGNILTVKGTLVAPGEVHLPDLSLVGPAIVIDQVENTAEVQGIGSMTMVSTTDFEGKKLTKPTPLLVTWKQGMRFTGKQAVFRGSVQADQQNTTLLCQTMQVDLNRAVSLRQQAGDPRAGGAGREPANVDKVICDAGPDRPQGVIISETIRENGRVVSSKRIEADEVAIHKEEGWMDAANYKSGRGHVRIVQLGPKGEPAAAFSKPGEKRQPGVRPAPPLQPGAQEFKATDVRYSGTMKVNNQARTAQFRDGVDLLHLPVDSPEQPIPFDATVNHLPTGALYLHSQEMMVYSAKDANGQSRQVMIATGKANVTYGDQFFGSGDVIKFDEAKQQVTLEGLNGGYARARKLGLNGGTRGETVAKKIIYNRADDTVIAIDGYSVGSGQ